MADRTSILIITYNRQQDLLELLESLATQSDLSLLEEVLILNNASTETYQEVEYFCAQHPELKINYSVSPENLGVSRGRNKLMQEAKGCHLLVLDDDIILSSPTDFARMASVFSEEYYKEQNTGIVTFKVLYHENGQQQITAFPHKKYNEMKNLNRFLTYYYTGCCHILKKAALEKTGYYPTDFFYGMEEYDLAYRFIQQGYTLAYDDRVEVLHKESPKGRQANHLKLASQWVNKSKVAWRYLPKRYFVSTALMWSVEYIRKIKGNGFYWIKCWKRIFQIPGQNKRTPLDKKALTYLRSVEARLWY